MGKGPTQLSRGGKAGKKKELGKAKGYSSIHLSPHQQMGSRQLRMRTPLGFVKSKPTWTFDLEHRMKGGKREKGGRVS